MAANVLDVDDDVDDSASATFHVVKDPVYGENSVDVVNADYVERNFPGWREGVQTFVVPPRYERSDWYMPEQGSEIPARPYTDQEIIDRSGKLAEEEVVRKFAEYGTLHKQPMFILHNFNFEALANLIKERNSRKMININKMKEKDIIIVHRDIGIILVETKSMKTFHNGTYRSAKKQLDDIVHKLKVLCPNLIDEEKGVVKKVIACPNLEEWACGNDYVDLRKYNLSDFTNWWHTTIAESRKPDVSTCKEIYLDLVPTLLFGRGDICICLNIKLADQIGEQASLGLLYKRKQKLDKRDQKGIKKCKANDCKIPTVDQLEFQQSNIAKVSVKASSRDQASSRNKVTWLYLTPEQCGAWKKCKQVICGTYGCGKTILLQCKAMTLARSDHRVLVIVPLHLKPVYEKFFTDNLQRTEFEKNIKLFSVEQFYDKFDEWEVLTKDSHVFVDELLWRYVDSNRSNTISSYRRFNLKYSGDTSGDNTRRKVNFLLLLSTLLKDTSSNWRHVWIVPSLFYILPRYFTGTALNYEASYFDELFFQEKSNLTGLNTIMRTCKEIYEHMKKEEHEDLSHAVKKDDSGFFKTDIYQKLFCNKLGHSISARPILGTNIKINKCPVRFHDIFLLYCIERIWNEINELLKEVWCVKSETEHTFSIQRIQRKKEFEPRDIVIIANSFSKISLMEIMDSIELKQPPVKWKLCTIQDYHKGHNENAIPICYSKDVASLEWPVVIHIRNSKRVVDFAKDGVRATTYHSLGEDNVIVSRCILYYILICPVDDDV